MSEQPCPRFRSDMVVRRLVESGEIGYTIYDPLADKYYRQPEMVGELCLLLDGRRTRAEVLDELGRRYPQYAFNDEYLDEMLESLRQVNFLEDAFDRNLLVLERAKQVRQGMLRPDAWRNILNVQLGFFDPLPLFRRIHPVVRVVFTPYWFAGVVLAFLVAMGMIWSRREVLTHNFFAMFQLADASWVGFLILYVVLFATIFAHEVGHGLCCYHYGGKPRQIGFLLLYFMPGMFCDTSDIYFFDRRWPRAAVALAGSYVEIQVFTLATFVWAFTASDLLLNDIAYRVMLFAGITGLLFNMNPLIKLDGYYVLMSWLDIPDLREKAFAYVRGRAMAILTRDPSRAPRATRRERRIFLTFGLSAMAYSLFFLWISLLFLHYVLVGAFREVGVLLFLAFFFNSTKGLWKSLWRGGQLLVLERAGYMRRKAALVAGGVCLAILVLVVPLPHDVKVEGVLFPLEARAVRSPVPGRVVEVLLPEGAAVRRGTVLAVVGSPLDQAERQAGLAERDRVTLEGRVTSRRERQAETAARDGAAARLAAHEKLALDAWLVSPLDGHLLTPRPRLVVGRWVAPGDSVLAVGRVDSLEVLMDLGERDVGDVAEGARGKLRLRGLPERTLSLAVGTVDLAPQGPVVVATSAGELTHGDGLPSRYFARARVANPDGRLRPGMTGRVRIQAPPLSLAARLARIYARLVRADFWF